VAPQHVDVIISPRSFDRSGGRTVTGPLWLRHGDRGGNGVRADFPEAEWTDFPVIVLGWWLAALDGLAGGAAQAACYFMDGPFSFTAAAGAGRGLLRVRCVEHGVGDETLVAEFTVPTAEVHETVRAAARSALAECERRGWADADVDELRRVLGPGGRPRSGLT
jgi:hypothetical protein